MIIGSESSLPLDKRQVAAPHPNILPCLPLHARSLQPAYPPPTLRTYRSFQGCGYLPGSFWLHAPTVQPPVPAGRFHCHCLCGWLPSPEYCLAGTHDHVVAFPLLLPPSHLLFRFAMPPNHSEVISWPPPQTWGCLLLPSPLQHAPASLFGLGLPSLSWVLGIAALHLLLECGNGPSVAGSDKNHTRMSTSSVSSWFCSHPVGSYPWDQ